MIKEGDADRDGDIDFPEFLALIIKNKETYSTTYYP